MKNYQWPYPNINQADFLSQIISVEKILQKYGAEFIGNSCEMGRWILSDGSDAYEKIEKKIWKRNDEYIRVDHVYFSEKPFLVLEFSQQKDGPYEDADPFPYDLPDTQLEQEIRSSLEFL